jgi:peptidoglycan/xylan/chitin deacetylase (PgdA/CDA1 family)
MLLPLLGASAAALLGAAGYQTMAPTGQWFGRTFTGLDTGAREIALTYDDGPNDPCTLRLLEVLARHHARATFFLIGRFVQQRPDIVRDIVKAGHAIGNHTYTHPALVFRGSGETQSEIQRCQQAIFDACGVQANIFRPPFGSRRPGTFAIVRELGLEPIMWNATGYDWDAPPAEKIVQNVSRKMHGGAVVLLHDGSHLAMGGDRAQTIIASDQLLARYKSAGYSFVAIPEMTAQDGRAVHAPLPS